MTNCYFINNTTSLDFLVKIFKEDRSALVVVPPNMNFRNARLIFEGFYKKLEKLYFGQELKDFNKTAKEVKFLSKE